MEALEAHFHSGQIALVLRGSRRAEADGVAEVIEAGAGHDRIEVDDAQGLARLCVEQNVIELRVVVRDAQRQLACLQRGLQRRHFRLPGKRKFDLGLNLRRPALYLALFAFSILIVFRVVPFWLGLVLIPAVLLFADRDALRAVDYPLLLTFVMFFIFAGNASRIEVLHDLLAGWLAKSTLLVSTLSCQFISNVPSAILLSRFTDNYRELLLGVNIGGTGTLIASLASLITYSEFKLLRPGEGKKYLGLFTLLNVIFLAVLTAAAYWLFR